MPRKPKAPEAPKDSRCCGTCRHWKRTGEAGEDASDGVCNRMPAQIVVIDEMPAAIRPSADYHDDPCGEHAPVLQ